MEAGAWAEGATVLATPVGRAACTIVGRGAADGATDVAGGGTLYSIVDVVTVLAVDPGRLKLMLLPLEAMLEATLVTVGTVGGAATPDEAATDGNNVVPEESVCICS